MRNEQLLFMKNIMKKIANHQDSSNKEVDVRDYKFEEDLETMTGFYKELNEELKAMLFGGKKVEKYTISEYFESCKKSKFKKHIEPH